MNLLLAEDDAVARLTLSAVLKGLGYEVTEAEHGGEAWANLQLGYFPIVISDWQMPEVDGPELCRRIRARPGERYTYFLLVTATGGKKRYLEGMDAGAWRSNGIRSSAMSRSDQRRNSVTGTVPTVTRSTSGRKLKNLSLLVVALLAVRPSGHPAAAQTRGISDNSFLIEEAYNQEPGVVQHISAWQRSLRSAAWGYTFTQEWPLGGQTHQLSYTLPVQRTASPRNTGIGDVALNYRLQMRRADARAAIAPRLSMILPTGNATRGLGTGHVGAQLNVPVSVSLTSSLVSHWNAGVTAVPRTTTYNLGASMIWLARPTFNVMLEVAWTEQSGAHALVVNPGIRWAHNFSSGLQVVPGLAFPFGVGPSRGERGAFFYLSFEHRFRPAEGP